MKRLLIGSAAAKVHYPQFRTPKDWDYLCDEPQEPVKGTDFHYAKELGPAYVAVMSRYQGEVASPTMLYTLKLSHALWDVHWHKTMADILFFQEQGLYPLESTLDALIEDNRKRYRQKKCDMDKTNEEFFNDAVDREYSHDDIHRAVAYTKDEPLFEKIKKDLGRAEVSEDMFLDLPFDTQIKLMREEIHVTALERFLIPKTSPISSAGAYRKACRLLVTSMTDGWVPRFIILNWKILHKPDGLNFLERFNEWKQLKK